MNPHPQHSGHTAGRKILCVFLDDGMVVSASLQQDANGAEKLERGAHSDTGCKVVSVPIQLAITAPALLGACKAFVAARSNNELTDAVKLAESAIALATQKEGK